MGLRYIFPILMLGLVLIGWGAGMVSVHYLIGNSSPINSVNAVGLIVSMIGFALTISSLIKMKGVLDFKVVEE